MKSSKAPKKDFDMKIKETVLECIKIRADEAGTEFSCSQCNFKTYESEKLNVYNVQCVQCVQCKCLQCKCVQCVQCV